jgi:hypothetical protein
MTLLKAEQLYLCATTMSIPVDTSLLDQIRAASIMDPLVLNIKHHSDNNRENSSLWMTFFTLKSTYIFRKDPYASESYKFIMIFQPLDILVSTKHWNSFLKIFGGPKCGKPSKNLCYLVTLAPGWRTLDICKPFVLSSIWTSVATVYSKTTLVFYFYSSPIYYLQRTLMRYL